MPSLTSLLPAGLAGYQARRGMIAEEERGQMQQMQGAMTLQGLMQQQQERQIALQSQAAVRDVLAQTGGDPESAIPALMRAGPSGLQAASTLSGLLENQAQAQERRGKAAEAARKAAFFSPENQGRFAEPTYTAPTTPNDDDGNPNPPVEGERRVNFDRFLQAAATSGVVNPETYAAHRASEQNARDRLSQEATLRREQIEAQREIARQRSEDMRLTAAERNQARVEAIRLAASLRPQTPEPMVPVKGDDGRVVYMPRSQAAGREVGGRTTDVNLGKSVQQLGTAFEKAGLPSMIPVIETAGQITPEMEVWVSGPRSGVPDMLVRDVGNLKAQDIRQARQDVAKLFNITLKDRSGAAVTNQELERLKKEFGTGMFKAEGQLIGAIKRAREIIEAHYNGIAASFGKPALDAYNQNVEAVGGRPFRPAGAPAGGSVLDQADAILKGG